MILTDNMAHRVIETGKDSIELGRWTWIRLQEKNRYVTLLLVYRPCKPSISGIHTIYERHARILPLNQEPISQFLID